MSGVNDSSAIATRCAICDTLEGADVLYPARRTEHTIDATRFSARIAEEQQPHYRIVRCKRCGLIRADPITIDQNDVSSLYQLSHLTYEHEIPNARLTYGHYLGQLETVLPAKDNLLEIGCGNGFFLEEALDQGFKNAYGVEPSHEAVGKAAERVRDGIKVGMFSRDLFPEKFFDVICIFQTLDHFLDPSSILADCFTLLKPGGVVLAINHNIRWLPFRMLGESAPIICVQHPFLYDPSTMRQMFEKHSFHVRDVFNIKNKYSLGYLLSLAPIRPAWAKALLTKAFTVTKLAQVPVRFAIGNIAAVAQRPA